MQEDNKQRWREKADTLFRQSGSHKGSFLQYLVLRAAIAVVIFIQVRNRDWQNVFLCVAVLLLFIFSAEILGEAEAFYVYFPWWDTMLHTLNGFIVAALEFSLVQLLNENEKVVFSLSPIFVVIMAFSFSMTVGVIWEFIECGWD